MTVRISEQKGIRGNFPEIPCFDPTGRETRPGRRDAALVLIDAGVPAPGLLAKSLTDTPEILHIGRNGGPLQVLERAVRDAAPSASSVHLFCHGRPGALSLSAGDLDLDAIARDTDGIAALRQALAGRPLVLYGCSVGRGDIGRRFVTALSFALDVPVLASSTPTGNAGRGGDWVLDVAAGDRPEAFLELIDPERAAAWPGLLPGTTNVTTAAGDTSAGSLRAAAANVSNFQTYVFQDLGSSATISLGGNLTFSDTSAIVWQYSGTTDALTVSNNTITTVSHLYMQIGSSRTITINSDLQMGAGGDRIFAAQSGNAVLNGSVTNVGTVQINGGTTTLGTTTSAGTIDILSGGTLRFTTDATYTSAIEIEDTATIDTNGRSVSFSGAFTDDGTNALVKTGSGTLTLSGTNTASGTMTVNQGTLSVAADANLSGGAVTINGGTLAVTGATTINNAIVLGSSNGTINASANASVSGNITGTGSLTKIGTSTLTLAGTNTYSGGTTISGGTLRLSGGNALSDSGTVTVNAGATLDLNNTSETIGSLAGSGTVSVGSGSITLSSAGSNSFSGSMTGTGTFTVASGVTLKGTSTYATAVTVQSGGTIAPGNSPGKISTGNLTLSSGSTAEMEINGTTAGTQYDQIAVTGTVTISNATLTTNFGYTSAIGDSYVLIDNDGTDAVTGTFSGLAEGATIVSGVDYYQISYAGGTGNDVVLTRIATPVASSSGSATTLGSEGNDVIVGDSSSNLIRGLGGNDTITGLESNDTIWGDSGADLVHGGTGSDLIYGNQGADVIYGNQGLDTIYGGQEGDRIYSGQDADLVYGNTGADTLCGNLGDDRLHGGDGNDLIYGNQGADKLWGGGGADTLCGGQDADHLEGGAGNDSLAGNRGADTLVGGDGADTLVGGEGSDHLYGNAGADLFSFGDGSGADIVLDFFVGEDVIGVSANINGSGIASASEMLTRIVADGSGNAVIDLAAGNSVTLIGVAPSQLGADSFLIV
ncbi:DUF4347 domain-containing protein [Nisaea sp.]|uniref:DUF4347 domain-containing protein n=1 Tax=Nisaea sp. TaxID=2024842 RepID=UPI0025F829CD|nr:DUF4347 domain-containing protein [Nisaea sp.]